MHLDEGLNPEKVFVLLGSVFEDYSKSLKLASIIYKIGYF
jgi:hypothetical protein